MKRSPDATFGVTEIPISRCRPSRFARPVDLTKANELALSIEEVGLRQPINVRPLEGGDYEVRGGNHRVAAFRLISRDTIPAFVREESELMAELAEIDENLERNELSPIDRADAQARRRTIYQTLYPETRPGGDRRSNAQVEHLKSEERTPRFDEAAAHQFGLAKSSVRREVYRGEVLGEHKLAIRGTSLDRGEELDALTKLPVKKRIALIERAKAGEKVSAKIALKQEIRADKEKALADRQHALPRKKYNVILADPEWRFEPWSRETGMDRAADNHYPTSATDVIAARDVPAIAARDCVLFLWATVPVLRLAFDVMAAWGFDYVTGFVWVKDKICTGYWNRSKHEVILVGTRGKIPAPAPGTQWDSVIEAPVTAHSEKPDALYRLIEEYFPNLLKIELNARRARPGWDRWGAEAPPGSGMADGPTDGELAGEPSDAELGAIAKK